MVAPPIVNGVGRCAADMALPLPPSDAARFGLLQRVAELQAQADVLLAESRELLNQLRRERDASGEGEGEPGEDLRVRI